MTDLIELGILQKHPNELIEINIIKEYLIAKHVKMFEEINLETEKARKKGIPNHLINIFVKKLEERKELINQLLKEILIEYWKLTNKLK